MAVPSPSAYSFGPYSGNGYWPDSALHALFGIFSPSLCFSSSAFLCFLRAIIRADRLVGGRIWLRHCLSCFYLLILFSLPCGACMCWHAHVSARGATNMADISQFLAYTFAHTAVAVGGREGLMSAREHVLHPIFLNIEIQLLIFHLASSALVSREKTLNTQSTRMPSFFLFRFSISSTCASIPDSFS